MAQRMVEWIDSWTHGYGRGELIYTEWFDAGMDGCVCGDWVDRHKDG